MRIIKESRVLEWCGQHPVATTSLMTWLARTREAMWANLAETRKTFPTADAVKVDSRRTATVFDIRGNEFRLITAIHYNTQLVFTMKFMTHAEYSKDRWKGDL